MGVPLISGTYENISRLITNYALSDTQKPVIVSHININNFYHLQNDSEFQRDLIGNAILLFDGIGMKLAEFIMDRNIVRDLNGTDLFPLLMKSMEKNNIRIFFLGSKPEVVRKAVQNTVKQYKNIKIVGYESGYFSTEQEPEIVRKINDSGADMLIIGMGFVKQEKFALKYRKKLNVKLIWTVGGLFDFVSATKKRAPLLMRKIKLEWLFRFIMEPSRMFHRNFIAAPLFFKRVLTYKYIKRNDEKDKSDSHS
jgi:N-acetylglucosaminyldiphosphoundecaprenol N-acetyl-beta-D-mannosaminyltransferase